ncbi:response regulator transcription factor [Ensifer aridi]|uniref:response regulator transcription factor n=1 Tax=Ensifer aridi TaxID=1708715 RepID=UPI001558346A|nr:response regulator transcription factor [Ensifer aridi]
MSHEIRQKIVLGGEIDFVNLLKHIVENDGMTALVARCPEEVVMLAETERPSLIVLSDFGSHVSAILARDEVFISIPKCSAPVLVLLNAQDAEVHADKTECLIKPFSPAEFVARLRSLLRPPREGRSNVLGFADIVMDLDAYRVYRHSRCIHLSPIEYRLLRHLLSSPRKVFTRGELLVAAWDRNVHVELRAIDVHMSRLRKALSSFGDPNYIRTVRSAGYSIDTADDKADIL